MTTVLLWLAVVALFALGLVGTIVPVLPGIALVYAGIVLYGLATGFRDVSVAVTVGLGIVALLAWLITFLGPTAAVRKSGGRKRTIAGTVFGMLVGLVFAGPFGLIVGAFLGALIGALMEGRTIEQAAGIAGQSILGTFAAAILQCVIAIVLIAAFFIAVIF